MDVIISLVKFYSNIRYYHGQRNVSKLFNKFLHVGISFVLKEDSLHIFFMQFDLFQGIYKPQNKKR